MKKTIIFVAATCAWLGVAVGRSPLPLQAQNNGPKFEVDPWWPKPLPERWIIGRTGGIDSAARRWGLSDRFRSEWTGEPRRFLRQ